MRWPTALAFAATALVVVLLLWPLAPTYVIGSTTTRDAGSGVALVASVSPVTADRWDSLESPRGTDYQVPAGQTLYITEIVGSPQVAASTSVTLTVGYGDTAVGNATSAPDAAVVVFVTTWEAADGAPLPIEVYIPIPAGKYPYVLPSGASNVQATGTVR